MVYSVYIYCMKVNLPLSFSASFHSLSRSFSFNFHERDIAIAYSFSLLHRSFLYILFSSAFISPSILTLSFLLSFAHSVFPDRGTERPPPLTRVEPHKSKHGVSVCLHFLAQIPRCGLLSQDRELCFSRLRVKVARSR